MSQKEANIVNRFVYNMKNVGIKMPESTVINENYVSNKPPLKKTNSNKNVVALPEVKFPTNFISV